MSLLNSSLRSGTSKITRDIEFVDKFIKDYKNADISEKDNTMLDYVVKLPKEPRNMVKSGFQSLRDAGLSDEGILDIVQVAGYYTYVNPPYRRAGI